jgi:hypothetical protein
MKKNTSITLLLIERNGNIEVSIDHNDVQVLKINKHLEKTPRVIGFNQPRITQEQFLEIANREVNEGSATDPIGFLREYMKSIDSNIESNIKEIQRILRKSIIHAESKNVANQLVSLLIKQSRLNKTELNDNPLEKKPHPWAKCLDCGEFYHLPQDTPCSNCGGYVKNELRPNIWFECQVCEGTGYNARFKKVCSSCNQKGWLFAELFKP